MLAEVCAMVPRERITAVACGVGPGPYTGLRVGIASAIALGLAWQVPVYGLCSLDALAAAESANGPDEGLDTVRVASDARRREVYWAEYDRLGNRLRGPRVNSAEEMGLAPGHAQGRWVAQRVADLLAQGEQVVDVDPGLDAHGSDTGAAEASLRGAALLPPRALYLRRPDAVEPVVK
jgi:tRNA threonylcarbamoyl adenosine modification protein YeaZ